MTRSNRGQQSNQVPTNEEYWRARCSCGNVECGARIVAWVGVVLSAIVILLSVIFAIVCATNTTFSFNQKFQCEPVILTISIVVNVVVIIVSCLILLAQQIREPAFYLPYLFLSVPGFIIYLVYLGMYFVASLVNPVFFIVVIVGGAFLPLMLWMYYIVWRAYQVLMGEARTRTVET